jgi:PilZ domain
MNTPGETSAGPVAEKRRAPRTRCLRPARCVFNRGYSDFTVLVRNISATGAKLTGDELFRLPEEFELQMADAAGAAVARRVRRVWSRADSIGVEFLEPEHALPSGAVQAATGVRI